MIKREPLDRKSNEIRPLTLDLSVNRYAEGSVLVKAGHTHVICTATIEEKLPDWLRGKGQGWITAEYSMLPRSTHTRSRREREKLGGRTHEIQRLIGRALRIMLDLKLLGERQILVDCDVIQADGGTRTAAITGSCVAVAMAVQSLLKSEKISTNPIVETVSAISVGLHNGQVLVDLDYNEDSTCEVDMNFVVTGSGKFVEVQGTAERNPFDQVQMNALTEAALFALNSVKEIQLQKIRELGMIL